MNTYPVSDAADEQYRGCGYALVAIADGEAVAIAYVRDILPELDDGAIVSALDDMDDERLLTAALRLSRKGEVIAAMCSSWTVVELEVIMSTTQDRIDA